MPVSIGCEPLGPTADAVHEFLVIIVIAVLPVNLLTLFTKAYLLTSVSPLPSGVVIGLV